MNYIPSEVFLGLQEVPKEISLIIPLAGCGHACKGCHSPSYQNKTTGEELTTSKLDDLLIKFKKKASCVCLFSGEHEPESLSLIIDFCKLKGYKVALYTGYEFSEVEDILGLAILEKLDYLKVGSYIESLGGLNSPRTNQTFFEIKDGIFTNTTKQFWRKII